MCGKRNTDELCVNTIRMLAIDQVERARSGHPGMPLGAAPMAHVLFARIMRHNPRNPAWINRDRFVLSAGHGSALLYAVLHLTGYDLPREELMRFRRLGSKTPGHPEHGCAPGVEATTGPLGQGFGMGVGMAMAERFMRARFGRENFSPIDHFTYSIVSDGDLMEGVASEAASLAGHLRLGRIIYLYDDNHISIEGATNLAFSESVPARFEAYGWHVQRVADGNDCDAIERAVKCAQADERPSLVCVRTHIGFGSPKHDQASAHGEPLGADAMKATREHFGWPEDKTFHIPDEAAAAFTGVAERGAASEKEWNAHMREYCGSFPEEHERLMRELAHKFPAGWDRCIPAFPAGKPLATRAASGKVINALAAVLPNLIGGSADLAPSTKTLIEGGGDMNCDVNANRNVHFGVREHAMGSIVNGMALHGGVVPYGATFLIFSDYMRPAMRLAALMNTHAIFVFTHDSVGLGEDGPTHQPIEHLMSLRAMPGLTVFRPADANETAIGWRLAIERRRPFAFALGRQDVPILDPERYPVADAARGAYVLADCEGMPEAIIIATGSEVHIALEAQQKLKTHARVRVVSMPSWEIFEEQPKDYRDEVLPTQVKARVAIEAGATLGWWKWVGSEGAVVGVDRFGASAPYQDIYDALGLTADNIVEQIKARVWNEKNLNLKT